MIRMEDIQIRMLDYVRVAMMKLRQLGVVGIHWEMCESDDCGTFWKYIC